MELPTASAEGDLLEQVLSLDFSKLVKLTQGANAVEVLVNGTELLESVLAWTSRSATLR